MIDTNLTASFVIGREAAKRMIPRGKGKIITIGSLTRELARATIAPYSVSKGGIKPLTKAMAAEWGVHNIQANQIGRGYTITDMNEALISNPAFDAWVDGRTPAKRWGKPEELVRTVVFFASAASEDVNGSDRLCGWRYGLGTLSFRGPDASRGCGPQARTSCLFCP